MTGQIAAFDLDSRLRQTRDALIAQWRTEIENTRGELSDSFASELRATSRAMRAELDQWRAAAVQEALAGIDERMSGVSASLARELKDASSRGDENLDRFRRGSEARLERLERRVFGG